MKGEAKALPKQRGAKVDSMEHGFAKLENPKYTNVLRNSSAVDRNTKHRGREASCGKVYTFVTTGGW